MKKIVCTLFLLPVLLAGCRSQRSLAESPSRRDSVRIETSVRTEYVPDTVFIEILMESERVTVRDTASRLETSYAVSDARLNTDGSLYHSLENKARKRPVQVKKEVVYRDSVAYKDRAVTETVTVKAERELTWWEKTRLGTWKWLAAALALCVGWAARKPLLALARRLLTKATWQRRAKSVWSAPGMHRRSAPATAHIHGACGYAVCRACGQCKGGGFPAYAGKPVKRYDKGLYMGGPYMLYSRYSLGLIPVSETEVFDFTIKLAAQAAQTREGRRGLPIFYAFQHPIDYTAVSGVYFVPTELNVT